MCQQAKFLLSDSGDDKHSEMMSCHCCDFLQTELVTAPPIRSEEIVTTDNCHSDVTVCDVDPGHVTWAHDRLVASACVAKVTAHEHTQ